MFEVVSCTASCAVQCFFVSFLCHLQASLRLIHASVNNFETTKDAIFASRGLIMNSILMFFFRCKLFSLQSNSVFVQFVSGATMSHSVRRPPNAMNFLRQLEILKKSGEADNFDDLNLVGTCWNLKTTNGLLMFGLCRKGNQSLLTIGFNLTLHWLWLRAHKLSN